MTQDPQVTVTRRLDTVDNGYLEAAIRRLERIQEAGRELTSEQRQRLNDLMVEQRRRMAPTVHTRLVLKGKRQAGEKVFVVEGRGEFPLDMLRYDSCRAASEADQRKIDPRYSDDGATIDIFQRRQVRLVTTGGWASPHVARWQSFGWSVVESPAS